jgi:quercetin dioxygenase-like cupin family protein
MKVTRNATPTAAGPAQWFTGDVYIDSITAPSAESRVNASHVHFTPGARTAWHRHPNGQTLWVTDGVGRVARRGAPAETIAPGDRVFFEPNEEHWHGATPDRFMSHLSIVVADAQGKTADWGEHVTDEEYNAQP